MYSPTSAGSGSPFRGCPDNLDRPSSDTEAGSDHDPRSSRASHRTRTEQRIQQVLYQRAVAQSRLQQPPLSLPENHHLDLLPPSLVPTRLDRVYPSRQSPGVHGPVQRKRLPLAFFHGPKVHDEAS